MNEYAICSLQTNDPALFQEKINKMVKDGYEPAGPMSVFPLMLGGGLTPQSHIVLLFVLLMKRFKQHSPNT